MPTLATLRQLAYLAELSERLDFRVAAEAQFVTQSTLSAGIKELETLLGVQLVERDKHHVRLTAVGEDVVARARELLAAARGSSWHLKQYTLVWLFRFAMQRGLA